MHDKMAGLSRPRRGRPYAGVGFGFGFRVSLWVYLCCLILFAFATCTSGSDSSDSDGSAARSTPLVKSTFFKKFRSPTEVAKYSETLAKHWSVAAAAAAVREREKEQGNNDESNRGAHHTANRPIIRSRAIGGTYWRKEITMLTLSGSQMSSSSASHEKSSSKRSKKKRPSVTAKSSAPKPSIVVMGALHANEWVASMGTLYALTLMLERYALGEADVVAAIDQVSIHVIPVMNPDGFVHSFESEQKRAWRRNRKPHSGETTKGVDLMYNWGSKALGWSFGSRRMTSERYQGPRPFSELETQAVRNFLAKHQQSVHGFLDVHCCHSGVMAPYNFFPIPEAVEEAQRGLGEVIAAAMTEASARAPSTRKRGTKPITYSFSDRRDRNKKAQGLAIDWIHHYQKIPLTFMIEAASRAAGSDPASQLLATTRRKYDHPDDIVAFGESLAEAMLLMVQAVADGYHSGHFSPQNKSLPTADFLEQAAADLGSAYFPEESPADAGSGNKDAPASKESEDAATEAGANADADADETEASDSNSALRDALGDASDGGYGDGRDILDELALRKIRSDEMALEGVSREDDEGAGEEDDADLDAYNAAKFEQLGEKNDLGDQKADLERQIIDREREIEQARRDRKFSMQRVVEKEADDWVKSVRLLDNEDFKLRKWASADVIEQLVTVPPEVVKLTQHAQPSNQDRVDTANDRPNARARKVQSLLESLDGDAVRFVTINDKKHEWAKDPRWKQRIVDLITLPEGTMQDRLRKYRCLLQLENDLASAGPWYAKLGDESQAKSGDMDEEARIKEEDRLDDEIIAHYKSQIRDIEVSISARSQLRKAIRKTKQQEEKKRLDSEAASAAAAEAEQGQSKKYLYAAAAAIAIIVAAASLIVCRRRRAQDKSTPSKQPSGTLPVRAQARSSGKPVSRYGSGFGAVALKSSSKGKTKTSKSSSLWPDIRGARVSDKQS